MRRAAMVRFQTSAALWGFVVLVALMFVCPSLAFGQGKPRGKPGKPGPGVVGWQHGFGHWALGRVAKGKGTNTGQFLPTRSDSLSGQSLNKECCVRISKV